VKNRPGCFLDAMWLISFPLIAMTQNFSAIHLDRKNIEEQTARRLTQL